MTKTPTIDSCALARSLTPECTEVISRLVQGEATYSKQIIDLRAGGYDIVEGQKPKFGASGCSDSRYVASTIFNSHQVGEILTLESPGGAMAWGNKLTNHSTMFLDLLAKYGVPKIAIIQHYGCGGMAINSNYHGNKAPHHNDKTFAHYIRRNFPGFTKFCQSQKALYNEVVKIGIDKFEESREIQLFGEKLDRVGQASAILQAEVDGRLVKAYGKAAKQRGCDYQYPTDLKVYLNLGNSTVYAVNPTTEKWQPVTPMLKMASCDCGLHHK